jgi:aldose sugar dehydrogenase
MHRRRVALTVLLAGLALLTILSLSTARNGARDVGVAESAAQAARNTPSPAVSAKSPPRATPTPSTATGSSTGGGGDVVAISLKKDNKIALVDPATLKVTRTLDAGLPPGTLALAPDKQMAWVFSTRPGDNVVSVVDLVKGEKRADRRLHDGPSGAAFSTDGTRAYVALAGQLTSPPGPSSIAFLNTTGGQFGEVTVGQQTKGVQIRRQLAAVAVVPGPNGDVLYAAAQGSGVVWALDAGSGALLAELEVGGAPHQIIADPDRNRAYVLCDATNQVIGIDTSSLTIADRLDLPSSPAGAAVGSGGTLYVAGGESDGSNGLVWIVGPGARLRDQVAVPAKPAGVAISSDGTYLYVPTADGTLNMLNTSGLQVNATVALGAEPVDVVVAERALQAGAQPTVPSPTARPQANPTPTIVPTPTALPEGARPPEHMLDGVVSENFLSGADIPVSIAFAADGRLFYNELKTGKIRVVQNGTLLPEPFYQFAVAGQPETGLLGLTLDPDFVHNHYVYVFYTSVADGGNQSGGSNGPNQVVRLTDVDNKGTDLTPILKDLPSGPIHNAGTVRFGPDGKLYVSLGDTDQGNDAQDLSVLPGKILRVNPDGSIPDDNPFAGQQGKQGAIWAYGMRNPYSFAFHPVGHQLLLAENGPGDNDELDVVQRGANYGWPPTGYKYKAGVVDPIAVMNPPLGPTGTTFYMGDQMPVWKNDLFYCNYHQGQLRRVHLAPGSFDRVVFEEVVKQGCSLDVATGPDGALYYSDFKGIYRLRQPGMEVLPAVNPQPAAAVASASPTPTEELAAGTRVEDRDVNISLSEWKMEPSRTTIPAGSVRLLAEDIGLSQHAFQIVGGGLDVSTDAFGPGQSRSVTIVLPAGTYQLICPIPGHAEQGMVSSLNVVGP